MISQLLKIIRESIKAVPAMKYALAVAGLLAVVALIGAFKLSPQMAVLGTVVTLVLMVAMVVFARLTTTAPRYFFLPAQVMMWAFLIVTVATAFLLFTSAFFRWPRGLRELFDSKGVPPTVTRDTAETRNVIAAAQQQRNARDFAGAWATVGRAVAMQPDSKEVRDEQVQIAMTWIHQRNIPQQDALKKELPSLTEVLYLCAQKAKDVAAADIHAHIGWANFLRSQADGTELKIEEEYAAAVKHDATNPFAHAMWGHWLATQRRPVSEIIPHFQLALKSGRERAFVRNWQVIALRLAGTPESTAELLRVADEMRRAGEPLDAAERSRICYEVYTILARKDEGTVLSLLSPADHLLTFRWLIEGRNLSSDAHLSYMQARLTEANGDYETAAAGYRALLAQDTTLEARAKAGLARCEQHLASLGKERKTGAVPAR